MPEYYLIDGIARSKNIGPEWKKVSEEHYLQAQNNAGVTKNEPGNFSGPCGKGRVTGRVVGLAVAEPASV